MNNNISIIGHGLAGCTMAMTLLRKNIPFRLYGTTLPGEASMISSGLIAPITGRRYVKAWNIEVYLPFALDFYRWTESLLGKTFFFEVDILRFLKNEEARNAWEGRCMDDSYSPYISLKRNEYAERFQTPYGIMSGGYRLDTPGWIDGVKQFLLVNELMELSENSVDVEDLDESKIILATGATNPKYNHGIIPNKGELLIARLPEWNIPLIMKDDIFIVPMESDQYWIGSYYEPWPEHPFPTEEGKQRLLDGLRKIYTGPVEIIQHQAGLRPTVEDRRPLIGNLPGKEHIYMFNGMGTKTTSLAPFWADQLIRYIDEGLPLSKEVSPQRYSSSFS